MVVSILYIFTHKIPLKMLNNNVMHLIRALDPSVIVSLAWLQWPISLIKDKQWKPESRKVGLVLSPLKGINSEDRRDSCMSFSNYCQDSAGIIWVNVSERRRWWVQEQGVQSITHLKKLTCLLWRNIFIAGF